MNEYTQTTPPPDDAKSDEEKKALDEIFADEANCAALTEQEVDAMGAADEQVQNHYNP